MTNPATLSPSALPVPFLHHRAPAFFSFHTINSYEEGDALHIDLCGYDDMTLIDDFYMSKLRSEKPAAAQGTIRRWARGQAPRLLGTCAEQLLWRAYNRKAEASCCRPWHELEA